MNSENDEIIESDRPEEDALGDGKSPRKEPRICDLLCGKLGIVKRVEWPEGIEAMEHGRKIIFEDSYGTDWAYVLRESSLLVEEDHHDEEEWEGSGPKDLYRRGKPSSIQRVDDELTEEDRIDIAFRSLDGKAVRYCDEEDNANIEHLVELEAEAMEICADRIKAHNLPMKLLASDYRYDRSKVTFHFSAENRVDFRQLVRDLASIFKCRIELHQIGIRDEAKLYPGCGPCGEVLCCQKHLTRFRSVSIRMARLQNLPLNPSKISGNCGRLMCCLNYECETYSELSKSLPKIGDERDINGKRCTVVFVSPLTETITVQLQDDTGKKFTVTPQEYQEGRTAKDKYAKKSEV